METVELEGVKFNNHGFPVGGTTPVFVRPKYVSCVKSDRTFSNVTQVFFADGKSVSVCGSPQEVHEKIFGEEL